MNWFEFAPEREGMLMGIENPVGVADAAAPTPKPVTHLDAQARPTGLPADRADGVEQLLASLTAFGGVPTGLDGSVVEVLREVALRHPGRLQVVDAVTTGGTQGAAVVLVVERRTGPELTADDVARRFALTRRQGAVALLLARRHSNAEIARLLAVSPHTARHHTERVLERLGVSSRMQVAALVLGATE